MVDKRGGDTKMKTVLIALFGTVALASDALALKGCAPGTPTKIATGPNGKPLEVCLDGTWKTCYRDSQRIGNTPEAARSYCDSKNLRR
jgi:hypothetical protein